MATQRKFLGVSRIFFHEDAYRRSLDAIGLTRRFPGTSLTKAARLVGTTTKTAKKYAGSALEERSGRLYVKRADRLKRRMRLLTPHGEVSVTTTSSRTASRISRYSIAVQHFYVTGDSSELKPFRGKAIRSGGQRYEFVTDPRVLNRLGRAGAAHFLDIYASESSK
jgi:hypothetical protein